MTNPDQTHHDEHGRSGGGVRGAINDLLGRGDRTDDDRRVEDQHLAQERSASAHDAGVTDGYGTGRGSSAATVGAAAPQGERFDDQAGETIPGGARHRDVGPDGPGYDQHTLGDPQPGGLAQAQRQDAGHQDMGPGGTAHAYDDQPGVDHQRDGAAGARTVDIGGPAAEATTAPAGSARDDRHLGDDDRTLNGSAASATPSGTSVAATSRGEDSEGRERLVSADRAESYGSRWDKVKGEFVDEPRQAVADADALVGELLDELQSLFTEQRHGIERNLENDETSTEDMRLALRRYRSFFDRLLSI
jgi:hypothetical protein